MIRKLKFPKVLRNTKDFSSKSLGTVKNQHYIQNESINPPKSNFSTPRMTEDEKLEYFDSPDDLNRKVLILAKWVREAKHFIAFTGAGVSTSTGIPDFRSGYNTVVSTGPGAWEKIAEGLPVKQYKIVKTISAMPSLTHMSCVEMMDRGLLKFIVSQNVDGLHRKSGIPPSKLAELHGNVYVEKCKTCSKIYFRDFKTRTSSEPHRHDTGNLCDDPKCRGKLYDNIINFKESLDPEIIRLGFHHGRTADLCLALGSSLRVMPAAEIPYKTVERGGKLVIVNIQKTGLDSHADLVIHAFCDEVMEKLMAALSLPIPSFRLVRYLKVTKTFEEGKQKLLLEGVDSDGTPYSIFRNLIITTGGNSVVVSDPPYQVLGTTPKSLTVEMHFQGHYNEPPLTLSFNIDKIASSVTFRLSFDPFKGTWNAHEMLTS